LTVLDATAEPLVPYVPGDTLRFHRIQPEEFAQYAGRKMEAAQ
jgi:hypothetical protein